MPLNHYVTLGRSGLRVSPFCFGASTFGEDLGWGSSVKDSEAILEHFIAQGGNFIDTANTYTMGHSEKIIGDVIGRHPARRQRAVIGTKFFGGLDQGDPNSGGTGRKSLFSACEHSLRRLQTDYIDLYWMHCWDRLTPIDETMRALDDLVRSGKVRYIGFSNVPAWKTVEAQMTARFMGLSPIVAYQAEYSLLERTAEGEIIPMARDLGLGVLPWSPLKSGVLSGKYTRDNHGKVKADRGILVESALSDGTYRVLDELFNVARSLETTPARAALAWVRSQPGVASTLIGARTLAQLDDNLGALEVKLRPEHLAALDAVSRPKLNFPADVVPMLAGFAQNGATINGENPPALPLFTRNDTPRY